MESSRGDFLSPLTPPIFIYLSTITFPNGYLLLNLQPSSFILLLQNGSGRDISSPNSLSRRYFLASISTNTSITALIQTRNMFRQVSSGKNQFKYTKKDVSMPSIYSGKGESGKRPKILRSSIFISLINQITPQSNELKGQVNKNTHKDYRKK